MVFKLSENKQVEFIVSFNVCMEKKKATRWVVKKTIRIKKENNK